MRGYNSLFNSSRRAILPITLLLILVTLVPLSNLRKNLLFLSGSRELDPLGQSHKSSFTLQHSHIIPDESIRLIRGCNQFRGKWVPYPPGPQYTNRSGCLIEDGQNCMKFGRPDTEFMYWRWKPHDCELPIFDAARFLHLVKGKSMAFVGDSLARNHMQSLGCLLSSVARPVDVSHTNNRLFKRWVYPTHNFTLKLLQTTHLVKAHGVDPHSLEPIDLYLDEADEFWGAQVEDMDYVIISTGHWFSRPLIYHEKGKVVGCHMCNRNNLSDMTRFYGHRKALQTAFSKLLDLPSFEGTVVMRTISPTHFEAEERKGNGNCVRERPYNKEEVKLDWYVSMFYMDQMEEHWAAEKEGRERGIKFRLLDITETMRMRPDGHPNHYGHLPNVKKLSADCLHWCMPGPVDVWNELLLQLLEREESEGKAF
ncbi:hypothetical protein NMG60_11003784 [Bertholletia excelsa]